MSHIKQRLKDIFETTIESGIKYEGSLENPDYYGLFCKAAANEQLYKLMGNNLCMFNCELNKNEAIMILFSIPINTSEESGAKNVAERVMEVIENMENCFTTIDEVKSEVIQEDKFVYVTAIKKVGKDE
jgi:hypothetical protein